ncbi:hypothetical protein [Streptomyces tirandamycinicus]|uniref:Uncharacterized protein n=1 Tax=Streptomyces tirandamycinicus TaxID=2174846 RepID=A0A2S1T1S6_9ACTN|nr:hypothetical protein [Streptomyces tirandamycinicus]AWI32624.1 hypothetical protein DDW44_30355 [Streptomyces tirandamycinicus]
MKPTVMNALEAWKEASDSLQESAVNALRLALPGLDHTKTPTYCCPVMLHIDRPNDLGAGRVCVDDDTRATVELDDVPNAVIAEAVDEVFGIAWFDHADGPLEDEGPGTYNYDDEQTGAEYEVVLGGNDANTGRVFVAYVPVPYAVELLDAMSTARERQQREAAATS